MDCKWAHAYLITDARPLASQTVMRKATGSLQTIREYIQTIQELLSDWTEELFVPRLCMLLCSSDVFSECPGKILWCTSMIHLGFVFCKCFGFQGLFASLVLSPSNRNNPELCNSAQRFPYLVPERPRQTPPRHPSFALLFAVNLTPLRGPLGKEVLFATILNSQRIDAESGAPGIERFQRIQEYRRNPLVPHRWNNHVQRSVKTILKSLTRCVHISETELDIWTAFWPLCIRFYRRNKFNTG